jgi:rhodanese-related sulfurtransferase
MLKSSLSILAISLAAAAATATLGCDKGADATGEAAASGAVKELSVDELAALLTSDAPPRVLDANNVDTRKEYGTVPGATLLSSYDEYDVAELGGDKERNLVFYCGSTSCKAAEGAAKKALAAGYSRVHVMPDGIKGWSKAGKTVTAVN